MATLKSQSMAELLSNKLEDQSVKQFCLDNNLTEARYYYWRRRVIITGVGDYLVQITSKIIWGLLQ